MSHQPDAKKTAEWQKQDQIINEILKSGAENYFSNISNLKDALTENNEIVCCMDEGTAHIYQNSINATPRLCMAGSGILYPAADWQERLQKVAELYFKLGIKTITSHDGCGAAGIAHKRDNLNTEEITPDEYGKKWAVELQNELNKKTNLNIKSEHISGEQMVRPKEFHNARAVWFDTTGKWNPQILDQKNINIPKGFVIDSSSVALKSSNKDEQEYPFAELGVAINIAFGHHGFGGLFTEVNKFVVLVVGENQDVLEKTKKEVEEFIEKNKPEFKERIKVDGFVV